MDEGEFDYELEDAGNDLFSGNHSRREVMILARVLLFSSRSYLGLCLTGMVSELLLVSKEDRDPLGKARKVIRYQG